VIALSCSSALASPAQDLFDQALYYLTFYYNGFSRLDAPSFETKYQKRLDAACQGKADACSYEVASKVIESMLEEVGDAHTYLVSPDEQQDQGVRASGETNAQSSTSMGFLPAPIFAPSETDIRVAEVLEGGAAEEAGLRRGDRIVALNGQALSRDSNEARQTYSQIDGSGRPVKLSVLRGITERLEITVSSRRFEFSGLPWMNVTPSVSGGVARIVVPDFDTYQRVAQKLHSLVRKAQSLNVKSIIVDLRDNPGGFATECLAGVSAFIPDVVRIREARYERRIEGYRDGRLYSKVGEQEQSDFYEIDQPAKWQGKLAVLVNHDSASCAEVFAADVQFAKRGSVVGERTFGLGNTSARGFDLINGAGLYVTVTKASRLDGTPYPERITPEVFVKDDYDGFIRTGRDEMLERALDTVNPA
jgi:carboxyl-terminal processing protease